MLFLILLIAGLVLLFVSPPLFAAAHTVGLIISIVCGVLLAVQLLFALFVGSTVKRSFDRF